MILAQCHLTHPPTRIVRLISHFVSANLSWSLANVPHLGAGKQTHILYRSGNHASPNELATWTFVVTGTQLKLPKTPLVQSHDAAHPAKADQQLLEKVDNSASHSAD